MDYDYDIIGGEKVPPTIISEDAIMVSKHLGSIHIENGVTYAIEADNTGSVHVHSGAKLVIAKSHTGTINLDTKSEVVIKGNAVGSVNLSPGSLLIIESSGKLIGSSYNDGRMIIRGVYGGSQSGNGEFIIEESGMIKKPVIKNGNNYYYE